MCIAFTVIAMNNPETHKSTVGNNIKYLENLMFGQAMNAALELCKEYSRVEIFRLMDGKFESLYLSIR